MGQDTLALTTHKYKVTHANLKRYTQNACTRCIHTTNICLPHKQNAEGGDTNRQGQEAKEKQGKDKTITQTKQYVENLNTKLYTQKEKKNNR